MQLRNLYEQEVKVAAFALGRMNPATVGHELLVNAVKEQPGDAFLFLTDRPSKLPTDPLNPQEKLDWARKSFEGISIGLAKTVLIAADRLYKMGYREVTFLEGEDKLYKLLQMYNGKSEGKKGPLPHFYNFSKINYVQLSRDASASDATGMSGTKLRSYVESNDLESFKKGVTDLAQPHAEEMFMKLRQIMSQQDQSLDKMDEILGFATKRQPRATKKVKTLKIDDKALGQKVQDKLKQYRKDQAKKEGIELSEEELNEFVGNLIRGGGWILGQMGKLVGKSPDAALKIGKGAGYGGAGVGAATAGWGLANISTALKDFYFSNQNTFRILGKYGIPALVILFLLSKGKDLYDRFNGEDIEDVDELNKAIDDLHAEERSLIKKENKQEVDITTGKPLPKTKLGFNVRSKSDKIKDKKDQIALAKRNAPKSGWTKDDEPKLQKDLKKLKAK